MGANLRNKNKKGNRVDLAKYQELTGKTVSEADKARVTATIRKVTAKLETALGYSLSDSKNIYKEEIGKVQFQGGYPYYPWSEQTLLPADEEEGNYRLFYYNPVDPYLKTDPARNIYHVKLVQVQNDDEFVTIMDLNDFHSKNARKFGRFIQKSASWFNWTWYNWLTEQLGNGTSLVVAVDADWLTCKNMPNDLAYLWTDMVDYYSDENYSVSGSLKSESVTGHSWTRANAGGGKGEDLAPQDTAENAKILTSYAGPNGTAASRNPA